MTLGDQTSSAPSPPRTDPRPCQSLFSGSRVWKRHPPTSTSVGPGRSSREDVQRSARGIFAPCDVSLHQRGVSECLALRPENAVSSGSEGGGQHATRVEGRGFPSATAAGVAVGAG